MSRERLKFRSQLSTRTGEPGQLERMMDFSTEPKSAGLRTMTERKKQEVLKIMEDMKRDELDVLLQDSLDQSKLTTHE